MLLQFEPFSLLNDALDEFDESGAASGHGGEWALVMAEHDSLAHGQ